VVYSFLDFDRDGSMLWLLALFVVAVLVLGRWRGLGALAGLAFSLIVIVMFTMPAILEGSNAVWVALTTASMIAFAALFLAHGFEIGTTIAIAVDTRQSADRAPRLVIRRSDKPDGPHRRVQHHARRPRLGYRPARHPPRGRRDQRPRSPR
jgi:hypothetical protein